MTVKILLLKSGEDVIADVKEMVSSDDKVIGYFLTKACVIKLLPKETDSPKMSKKETSISMYPWMPLAKEKDIPLPTDWVVTMVTPIEKVETMYKEDVLNAKLINHEETLNGKTTDQTDRSNESTKISISD